MRKNNSLRQEGFFKNDFLEKKIEENNLPLFKPSKSN